VVDASFPVLPYDKMAAQWHARECARLEALGRPAPYVDGQIAAIAQVNGLILVTVNPKDFSRYKEMEVQDWSKRQARV
jgi:tRNA(fMet)-specific endonuclease VapC